MLPKGQADLAHPEAADWVMGTLEPAQAGDFQRHLTGCPHCRAAVAEFGQLGQMLQHLPPAAEPPPELEGRTLSAVLRAAASQRTPTQAYPIPAMPPEPKAHEAPSSGEAKVLRFPRWHPSTRMPAIAGAIAAAIVAAVVIPLALSGGGTPPVVVVIPLHATAAAKVIGDGAATGRATARQAGPSWTFDMTVHGLKVLPGNEVYECWYVAPSSTKAHPQLISGGTFVVGNSGSTTVTMTSGVDPRQFRTMEVTAESPGNGALFGAVLLVGRSQL